MQTSKQLFERRRRRSRMRLRKKSHGRPRMSVFRSGRHIYVQIIDDAKGVTVAAASTLEKDLKAKLASGANALAAEEVGKLLAARAAEAGVTQVVFDRGPYAFHGRVKALAEAARAGGLSF